MLSNKFTQSNIYLIILIVLCSFLFTSKTAAQCSSQIGELQVLNDPHEKGIFICYNDTAKVAIDDFQLMDSQC